MAKKVVEGQVVEKEASSSAGTSKPDTSLTERASTVPALDPYVFGYYWEREPGAKPEWLVFSGSESVFRQSLADALLNRRMTRLYLSAGGIWIEVPLPPIHSA